MVDAAFAYVCGVEGSVIGPRERALFRERPPFGLILFERNIVDPAQVRALVASFREIVGRADAPVLIDQEGGRVQRLKPPLWRAYPPARFYGRLHEREPAGALAAAWLGARLIGEDLAQLGITMNCLPVADLCLPQTHAVIGDRAFAAEPGIVASLARATGQGLLAAGVLPVVKHIPGHGRAMVDSHERLPVVETSRAVLEKTDFAAFAALADLPLAMTAHVIYSAIDPDRPATVSPVVIGDIVRDHIGFAGVLVSDDISMKALSGPVAERTAAAVAAGCDLVLHCNGDIAEMREVAGAVGEAPPRLAQVMTAARARSGGRRDFDHAAAMAEFEAILSAVA